MGILSAFWKRGLENPSTALSSPDAWLFDALGAYQSSSGVSVNPQTALTYPPVWRGVNLLANDAAKLPLCIYRRQGQGKRLATEHRSYPLLRRKPNREMTSFTFRKTLTAHAILQGNGFAYIFRDGDAAPEELIPLSPNSTYPIRANGVLWYVAEMSDGTLRRLHRDDVIHIKGLGYDGLVGYSLIAKAREAFGLGMAAQLYGSVYFRNNARPSVVLEHPGRLQEAARKNLRESWERMHSGIENSHRIAILEEGMKINPFSINARDSQLIETRQFSVRDVANFLNVPPHKLGDTARTSYSSLEQENQDYLDSALDPWLVNWEEECWDKLLTEDEKQRDTHHVEFVRSALLRANLEARGNYYVKGITNGWLSQNDVRDAENLNPVDGGDDFYLPLNIAKVQGEEEDSEDQEEATPASGQAEGELLNLPDIRQEDNYSCGAAAAMSVGKYFGVGPDTLGAWKTALGTDVEKSTNPLAIVRYLSELGLRVQIKHGLEIEDLVEAWKNGQPVICPIQEYGVPSKQASFDYGHYVVVLGSALGMVFVQDPSLDNLVEGQGVDLAPGRMMIPVDQWMQVWHDQDAEGNTYKQFGIIVGEEKEEESEEQPVAPQPDPEKPGQEAAPAPGQRARLLDAHRTLLEDAARRVAKRLGVHARKAAKKPPEFLRWIDGMEAEHREVCLDMLRPALEANAAALGQEARPEDCLQRLFDWTRERLLEASECQAKELEARVETCASVIEEQLPSMACQDRTQE